MKESILGIGFKEVLEEIFKFGFYPLLLKGPYIGQ
jgi:hypothetical protein